MICTNWSWAWTTPPSTGTGPRRSFLTDDAAHTLAPSCGFGLNTSTGNVAALGGKLATTLNSWAGRGLLDRYGTERRPIAVGLNKANRSLERTLRRQVPPEITWTAGGQAGPCGDGTAAGEQGRTAGVRCPGDPLRAALPLAGRHRGPRCGDAPRQAERRLAPGSEPCYRAAHAWWDAGTSTLDLFDHGFLLDSPQCRQIGVLVASRPSASRSAGRVTADRSVRGSRCGDRCRTAPAVRRGPRHLSACSCRALPTASWTGVGDTTAGPCGHRAS
ncbi:FAD-dependent monooxygenase [Streptomyces europaeiscabiei]|uniref:FAD-dependent monooxygenase n=1 Tax=Streptomyces europaeiscabiei TaxID=146819 RepID=UPI0029C0A655|nr:FAD-dependent monooxygenase [Streptomyces europaeiscabiei]